MVTELHFHGDIAFLEQYTKDHMVPRSLCWDVHPQQGDTELEPWLRYFNEARITFLGFLVDRKRVRLMVIDKDIRDLKVKLTPFNALSEYTSLSTSLLNHLEKEERDQRNKKTEKI